MCRVAEVMCLHAECGFLLLLCLWNNTLRNSPRGCVVNDNIGVLSILWLLWVRRFTDTLPRRYFKESNEQMYKTNSSSMSYIWRMYHCCSLSGTSLCLPHQLAFWFNTQCSCSVCCRSIPAANVVLMRFLAWWSNILIIPCYLQHLGSNMVGICTNCWSASAVH